LESTQGEAAARLAMVLGLPAGDLVRPAGEERGMPPIPESAELAAQQALADHPELSKLASAIAAKNIEADAGRAARLPKLDLVAQYGLFARFNNYEDFFRRFQRHNGQIGVSLQVPVWVGPATGAAISAAMSEAKRLEIELQTTRQRIRIEAQTSFHSMERAASARHLARLDLDVARENLSIVLARFEEGRTSMQEIEQARLAESGKWAAYYESQQEYELARYRVLEKSGGLLAAFPPAGR
jgi:outer membrane protein TolC